MNRSWVTASESPTVAMRRRARSATSTRRWPMMATASVESSWPAGNWGSGDCWATVATRASGETPMLTARSATMPFSSVPSLFESDIHQVDLGCLFRAVRGGPVGSVVLERQLHPHPVGERFTRLNVDVLLDDPRHAQVAQRAGSRLDGNLRRPL